MRSVTDIQQPLSRPAPQRLATATKLPPERAVSISQCWGMWYQRWATRRQLLALNTAQLRDIGLTRSQQYQEGRKPFWVK